MNGNATSLGRVADMAVSLILNQMACGIVLLV